MIDPSEDEIASELTAYIRDNKIDIHPFIIDIGANDGFEISNSFHFIHNLGWKGVLVEPQPEMAQLIDYNYRNIDKSKKPSIIVAAVSEENGMAKLTCHPNDDRKLRSSELKNMGASLEDRGGATSWEVHVITFQNLIDFMDVKNIGVLSIDTEGHDINVLRSMFQTTVRPKFIITEVWESTEKEKDKLLKGFHYNPVITKSSNIVYEHQPLRTDSQSLVLFNT